jgi:hypothetical protein
MPIQVSDSLEAIIASTHPPSSLALFEESSQWSSTTLRPVRYLQARWLVWLADATGTSYHAVFRGTHAILAALLIGLLTWAAAPRQWPDVAALAIALTVFAGLHTFTAVLREAFPVNHYAEVAAAALFAIGAARRPARARAQGLILALLAAGLLLIESAGLIWVVVVSAVALRLPGVRPWTAVAASVILVAVIAARAWLGISSPGIGGHTAGWGASFLSADDIVDRFSTNPWPFYAYNVAGGALSLLLSEPRSGFYHLMNARATGMLRPVDLINVTSSLLITAVLLRRAAVTIATGWRGWTDEDRVLLVGTAVAAASAVLCANYIKDDILSTAGAFYALGAYVAVRWAFGHIDRNVSAGVVPLAVVLVLAAPLWAFRTVGTHYQLRQMAFVARNDWTMLAPPDPTSTSDADRRLTERLRTEALQVRTTSPRFLPDWGDRYWID